MKEELEKFTECIVNVIEADTPPLYSPVKWVSFADRGVNQAVAIGFDSQGMKEVKMGKAGESKTVWQRGNE